MSRAAHLDVAEPDVRVEAHVLRLRAELGDPRRPGVVGREREERGVERVHRLALEVAIHDEAHVLRAGLDIGLDLLDAGDADVGV